MTAAYLIALLLPLGSALFCAGLVWRLAVWLSAPVPAAAALMPAPTTAAGVVGRVLREVFTFRSLWRASRWTWVLAVGLHLALLLSFAGHLRLLADPGPTLHWLATPVGVLLLMALVGLGVRRLGVDRLRYISTPSDWLWLALLGAIGLSGLWLGAQPDSVGLAMREYVLGLTVFEVRGLPAHPAVFLHLVLVSLLLALFPFGKLLHGPGIVISPARATRDRQRAVP